MQDEQPQPKPTVKPPGDVTPKRIHQDVLHDLTNDELLTYSSKAAELDVDIGVHESDLKEEQRQRKARIQQLQHNRAELLRKVRTRKEERTVSCLTWICERTRRRITVREDSHELVNEEPLQAHELQVNFMDGLPGDDDDDRDKPEPLPADDSEPADDAPEPVAAAAEAEPAPSAKRTRKTKTRKKKTARNRHPKSTRKKRSVRAGVSALNTTAPPG